ncbi:zinc-binding dehydrogenase [Actinoallomurus purpureus]|uniref:zinc-binding dehydrogenase n=1 Tax=Actinoallomurus purpureus TaxID=478114 RepID=UPI0020935D70|nr:zinc-binding dehydrogenase [Actinoallomurus purpureus]MCO6007326.1 zinc-binding dehydrogenase [Actinoallomurus purpureus]
MRAIRQYAFGPPENLRYEEVPDPRPGPGQVTISVRACGVHLVDTMLRKGTYEGPFAPPDLPMIPGREVAGVIDELGDGVGEDLLGRRVVAHLGMASGGYAERAVANVADLHALPDDLAYDAAVAMVGTGRMTIGILDVARPTADDVVLVTAAAGGIGTMLVQAVRNLGATVVGLAGGAAKVARVRESGATVAADYAAPDWGDRVREALDGRGVSLVLDGVGGEAGQTAFGLLAPGGRLVLFGWSAGEPVRFTSSDLFQRSLSASVALGPGILRGSGGLRGLQERALAEAAAGRLVPAVQTFALKDAPAAHRALETRATVGKVVLVP